MYKICKTYVSDSINFYNITDRVIRMILSSSYVNQSIIFEIITNNNLNA